jgi:glutathione S-transferase
MEKQLLNHSYIAGETFSIADIALFAYTHVADEGGFTLEAYPAIHAWMRKIGRRPRFVAMKES